MSKLVKYNRVLGRYSNGDPVPIVGPLDSILAVIVKVDSIGFLLLFGLYFIILVVKVDPSLGFSIEIGGRQDTVIAIDLPGTAQPNVHEHCTTRSILILSIRTRNDQEFAGAVERSTKPVSGLLVAITIRISSRDRIGPPCNALWISLVNAHDQENNGNEEEQPKEEHQEKQNTTTRLTKLGHQGLLVGLFVVLIVVGGFLFWLFVSHQSIGILPALGLVWHQGIGSSTGRRFGHSQLVNRLWSSAAFFPGNNRLTGLRDLGTTRASIGNVGLGDLGASRHG
mmetsp:Transcript_3140/g.7368  ORF Transcript_3140/g.7368 Transcript_3140/m.7368 type:complete len:282 (+) Transcript_3140:1176-2021(+)